MRDRSMDLWAVRAIRSTHSSTAESMPSPSRSIFTNPASAQEFLSHWQIWRSRIAAGTTGTNSTSGWALTTMPPECWERWRGSPAACAARKTSARQRGERSLASPSGSRSKLLPQVACARPAVGQPGEPRQVGLGECEGLAQLADRHARLEGGECRHERGVLVAVALDDLGDEALADVAREIEVDVRHRGHVAVEEAPQKQVVGDRIDMRQPGQIADDRAHRGAAPAAGGQLAPGGARRAHLERDIARQLEDVAVQQKEPRQPVVLDERQLLVQACARLRAALGVGVVDAQLVGAHACERLACGFAGMPGHEVGEAVSQVAGEIERAARGDLTGGHDGLGDLGEQVGHLLRWPQDRGAVAAPDLLGRVEGLAVADRHERVLQECAMGVMGMHVPGGDDRDPGAARQLAQAPHERMAAAAVGTLELDVQMSRREPFPQARQPRRGPPVLPGGDQPRDEPLAGASGQADQPVGEAAQQRRVECGGAGTAIARIARVGMGDRDQPAQVGIARARGRQQREVAVVGQGDLAPGDRLDARIPRGVCERQRAAQAVVVGQGHGRIAGRRAGVGELFGRRDAIEEAERRMGVQLDVGGGHRTYVRIPRELSQRYAARRRRPA